MNGSYLKDLKFKVIGEIIEKSADTTGRRIIRGYASVSDVLDRQNEIITREALIKAKDDLLKNPTIFYEHKHSELAVGKTIATEVDDKGLLITVEFTKAAFADDLWTLITEGIVNRFSIGGRVLESQEKRDKEGNLFNEIQTLELFETSIVGLPANPEAKFELVSKSFNKAIAEEIDKKGGRKEMDKEKTEKKIVSRQELQEEAKVEAKVETKVEAKKEVKEEEKTEAKVEDKVEEKVEAKEEVSKPKKNKKVKKSEESEEAKEVEETIEDKENVEKCECNSDEETEVAKTEETSEETSEEVAEEIAEELSEEVNVEEKAHTNNATSEDNLHWHEAAVDENGDGETTTIITKEGYTGDANHVHKVTDGEVETSEDHEHNLLADPSVEANTETSDEKAVEETEKSEEVEQTEEKESEETSLEEVKVEDKVEKPVEEIDEAKSIDEQILETLTALLEKFSTKKEKEVTEKSEEEIDVENSDVTPTEKENVEEAPLEEKETSTEEVTEEPVEEKDEKLEEEGTEKEEVLETVGAKSQETEMRKIVKPEVEKKQLESTENKEEENKEETSARKGEVAIVAEAPYSNEDGTSNVLSTVELKKKKDKAWTKFIFGDK